MKSKTTMKTTRILKGAFAATLVGIVTFTCMPAKAAAAHEAIYGVDFNNNLTLFYSDAPGTIVSQYAISGIKAAEEIRGIDEWGGKIYALGSAGYLYTLDTFGVATQVGSQFSVRLSGASFGVDNDPSGFRIVSGLGQNLLVTRLGVVTQGSDVPPRVDAIAYENATGKWYAVNTLTDTLEGADGTTMRPLGTIGPLRIDASRYNGFDISSATGIAYMLTPATSSDPAANLYTVDLHLGFATLQGKVGLPNDNYLFRAMTVVPESSSVALLVLGAVSLFIARRRQ
jgi:Domain of unknown function (DUF4394)